MDLSLIFSNANILWLIFIAITVGAFAVDYKMTTKDAHLPSIKEATISSLVWIGLATIFGGFIFLLEEPALKAKMTSLYFTTYVVEKSLSVDNLFVFIMIFSFFKLEPKYHHKVLLYGVIGAVIMRAIFIAGGMTLISYTEVELFGNKVNYLLLFFGLVLIWASIKTIFASESDDDVDFDKNFGVKVIKWLVPVKPQYYDGNFFIIENAKKYGTMLLLVVGAIEMSDIIFAVDSIPACLGVTAGSGLTTTQNTFLLYTSNIFAIMGLRQLYFLLAAIKDRFEYLNYGIGIVLLFIAVKMIAHEIVGFVPFIESVLHVITPNVSLVIIFSILVLSIAASELHPGTKK